MRLKFFVFLLVFIGGGIWYWQSTKAPSDSFERRQARFNDREVDFLLMPLSHEWEWELIEDPSAPKTVQDWRTQLGADLVFNAAYFLPDKTSAGFLKTTGGSSRLAWPSKEEQLDLHSYTFLLQVESHDLVMRYLPSAPQDEPTSAALLSFPTLIADGKPLVAEDSGMQAMRTVIAESSDGQDYLIITQAGRLSLFEIAQWLAKQPEQFVVAGNLDGGPSTGLSFENGNKDLEVSSALVPSVIVGRHP